MPHSPGGGAIDSRLTGRQRKTQTWSISASVFLSQNVEFTFVLCYSMQQKHLENLVILRTEGGSFPMVREYLKQNVYDALLERLDFIFREFDNIYISFPAGRTAGFC